MAAAKRARANLGFLLVMSAVKGRRGEGSMKQTSQRSLLFRQNVGRTEENVFRFELALNLAWYNVPPNMGVVSAMN